MFVKEQSPPPPKAVNIVRPSSPLFNYFRRPMSPHHVNQPMHDASHSSSTASSSPSTLSTLSTASSTSSSSSHRVQPTIFSPSSFSSGLSFFNHTPPTWSPYGSGQFPSPPPSSAAFVVNKVSLPQRLLQRPRSYSNLLKSTLPTIAPADTSDDEQDQEESDLQSLDGDTDHDSTPLSSEEEYSEEKDNESEDEDDTDSYDNESEDVDPPAKTVVKIKHGTIMNGKGEFLSKGEPDDYAAWLDEARAHRKIADLEIEKTSLLALNTTLEATVRRQAAQITELQKRLMMNDGPLTPVSDKAPESPGLPETSMASDVLTDEEIENDQVFQRLRSMLQGLIEQAEVALLQKTKASGKVLTHYDPHDGEESSYPDKLNLKDLISNERSMPPSISPANSTISNRQQQRPSRRGSQGTTPTRPRPQSLIAHEPPKRTPMQRSLSRASSPAILVTTTRPYSPPLQRTSPRSTARPSHLRRSQDFEQPKWQH
ncbi:uncharacterized protein BYT42DRAFT_617402 [Radiomyces spectabilis]|uniref:uncharacterized protein n=1 Tax=Radiomyces spectabilis TaxID=64574 RepID=UPI00221F4A18|nr:uncharacterized protein BYT42DRAFT_617402 [Radiomyces spectabilis]KAI8369372.1 hypothetical protein BYT42DRAFT_617402 [Radiomyces spectabilis]